MINQDILICLLILSILVLIPVASIGIVQAVRYPLEKKRGLSIMNPVFIPIAIILLAVVVFGTPRVAAQIHNYDSENIPEHIPHKDNDASLMYSEEGDVEQIKYNGETYISIESLVGDLFDYTFNRDLVDKDRALAIIRRPINHIETIFLGIDSSYYGELYAVRGNPNLVCDKDTVYCPIKGADEYKNKYSDPAFYDYFIVPEKEDDDGEEPFGADNDQLIGKKGVPLSASTLKELNKIPDEEDATVTHKVSYSEEGDEHLVLIGRSKDKLIFHNSTYLYKLDSKVYYFYDYNLKIDDENEKFDTMYLVPLSDKTSNELMQFFEANKLS